MQVMYRDAELRVQPYYSATEQRPSAMAPRSPTVAVQFWSIGNVAIRLKQPRHRAVRLWL